MTKATALLFVVVLMVTVCMASSAPVKPQPRDKCPVCGMFVAKYPDFVAEIIFKDKSYAVFDGAKDLFKYYRDLSRYSPARKLSDIDAVYVTNYYDMALIDGMKAVYVVGSNVYGPMGKELVPFAKESDAREFAADHGGQVLKFGDVTKELLRTLD